MFGDDHCKELASILCRRYLMQWNGWKHIVRQLRIAGRISGGSTIGDIGHGTIVGANDEGVNVSGVVNLAGFKRIEENAVSAAKHGLIVEPVCQTYAWSKGFFGTIGWIRAAAIAVKSVSVWGYRTAETLHGLRPECLIRVAQATTPVGPVRRRCSIPAESRRSSCPYRRTAWHSPCCRCRRC